MTGPPSASSGVHGVLLPLRSPGGASYHDDANRHLVCFAHAGAQPTYYAPWFAQLADRTALWGAVRATIAPGDAPERRWAPIVERTAAEIADLPGEVLLHGHSMGALLAYATAVCLVGDGRDVAHLVVGGRVAPHMAPPHRGALPDDPVELVRRVADEYGSIPEEIAANPQLARTFGPDLREDLELHEAYASYAPGTPQPLPMPITVVAGEDDPAVDPAGLRGWESCTTRSCSMVTVPGGHIPGAEAASQIAELVRPPG